MPRLYLVRHGHAAAGWGEDRDPGLDDAGRAQAEAVGQELAGSLEACSIVTSPLARARETAAPLERTWSTEASVAAAFGEIPSPTDDLVLRKAWLSSALASHWDDLDEVVQGWRHRLVQAVRSRSADTVAFTHFVAINAVVAAATADDAVTVFLPANVSVTVVDVDPTSGGLHVVRLGSEAPPDVG